jgi:hypothetical protein
MACIWSLAVLAAVVSAVPSPQSLKSDVTILIDNDLRGELAAMG